MAIELTLEELHVLADGLSIDGHENMSKDQLLNEIMTDWKIYSKEGCPYCKKAKKLLSDKNISFITIDVTSSNKESIYKQIDSKTNSYRYFPIIFYKNNFIGGYTELSDIFSENKTCNVL